jgi:hypothetical protein
MKHKIQRQDSSTFRHVDAAGKNFLTLPILRSLIFLTLSSLSAFCFADMYKCVDSNGTQVFSDKPCGPDAQAHAVVVQPHSASFDSSTSLQDERYVPLANPLPDSLPASTSASGHSVARRTEVVVVERKREEPKKQTSQRPEKRTENLKN